MKPMRLITLGSLNLEGSSYRGKMPLLLLTYLLHEGPKERGYLTQLFWPHASDPRNSLSSALTKLSKLDDSLVDADDDRAWAKTSHCDALAFDGQLAAGAWETALKLYKGPFLDGVQIPKGSVELEDWLFDKREAYVRQARHALLRLGETEAALAEFSAAARRAETAHRLEVAPSYEPEELLRLFLLLQAGNSPLAPTIRSEAEAYGVNLDISVAEARGRLQRALIGREREREQLLSLNGGEWAWLQGGPGMGKTTLLKSLPGTLLPGRSGLPYATLEPLLKPVLHEGQASIVEHLRHLEGLWLIDNWERVDTESKELILKLKNAGFAAKVVISSRHRNTYNPDLFIELAPLSPQDLSDFPDMWEQTKGLPTFVDAFLRKQPLQTILSDRLASLPETVRQVFLALALLDSPDLALVRRALDLDASSTAETTEALLRMGLIEPHGQVRVRQVALEYLESRPTVLGPLALQLARLLGDLESYPLYERSKHLWTKDDESKAQQSYVAWAKELLRRGFPQRAAESLAGLPHTRDVAFVRAIALEKSGRFAEAFNALETLSDSAEVLAIRASVLERLGQSAQAKEAAERALHGSTEARAKAQMTLGRLELSQAKPDEAARLFRRAATLFQAANLALEHAEALNNEAVALSRAGQDAQTAFEHVLGLAGNNGELKALAYLNLGREYVSRGEADKAFRTYQKAITLAEEAGALDVAARAWNNIGVYHEDSNLSLAINAYKQSLTLAQQTGEQRSIAIALGNLAALEENEAAWDEAMHLLVAAGQLDLVTAFYDQLPADHPFRERSDVQV